MAALQQQGRGSHCQICPELLLAHLLVVIDPPMAALRRLGQGSPCRIRPEPRDPLSGRLPSPEAPGSSSYPL